MKQPAQVRLSGLFHVLKLIPNGLLPISSLWLADPHDRPKSKHKSQNIINVTLNYTLLCTN
jgi:hypothetical protein